MIQPVMRYSLDVLREEARQLVQQGYVKPHQPIYLLSRHLPPQIWTALESVLEEHNYLLGDRIDHLIGPKRWESD
jgi:hypothetical protein